jgi:hypothetical protein
MSAPVSDARQLRRRVGDLRQVAAVRRLTLEDGGEAGVRALAFDTGGGLAFWALEGRGLDLATLSWRGMNCAWQGPGGFVRPGLHPAESEAGQGFLRSYSGLLVTCGLGHTRQPANGYPLHGRLPFMPARLIAAGEDWEADVPHLFAEAELVDAAAGGENWLLRRRLEAPIGGSEIRIVDAVTNRSAEARPQPILYHLNIGFPLLRPGCVVSLDGGELARPPSAPDATNRPEVTCRRAGETWWSVCAIAAPAGLGWPAVRLEIGFATDTLPYLQLLEDYRPGMNLIGVEPANTDRGPGGVGIVSPEVILAAGECRRYRLTLRVWPG